jgi:hypothetical protein
MRTQANKSIPLNYYDVIVCGGGTAGIVAAIAAARQGASVLIIEHFGSLGGTQANGWVTPMMPNYSGDHKLNRGIHLEILSAQTKLQSPSTEVRHGDVWYDPLMLSHVLDLLVDQSGVTVLLDATLIGVQKKDQKIRAVEVATRAGHLTISGKAFIDATGDAQLCYYAGAKFLEDKGGQYQPLTLRFNMGNIDLEAFQRALPEIWRFRQGGYLEAGFAEAKESPLATKVHDAVRKGILEEEDLGYFQIFTVVGRPRELAFNCPRITHSDPLDPFALSKAYSIGRAKIFRIAEFVRRYMPGCEEAYVSVIAPLMGIRESRRVVGEYVLTAADHLECQKFDDVVARNRYPVDIHLEKGVDCRKFPKGEWHDIPYRSLVVKGFENLWVAGRCLSADFVAQSAVRIQPVCRSMGEAVGVAAALCVKKQIPSMALPYPELAFHLDLTLPAEDCESPLRKSMSNLD